jgi:hypothetical protein
LWGQSYAYYLRDSIVGNISIQLVSTDNFGATSGILRNGREGDERIVFAG